MDNSVSRVSIHFGSKVEMHVATVLASDLVRVFFRGGSSLGE